MIKSINEPDTPSEDTPVTPAPAPPPPKAKDDDDKAPIGKRHK